MGKFSVSTEMMVKTLDFVDPAIDPKEFFAKYVQTRTPVVIRGLIRDEGFQASRWVCAPLCSPPAGIHSRLPEKTDLEYLSKKAGHVIVQVEPIHPEFKRFGTDAERIDMRFSEFLDGLKQEDGELRYLTTQYSTDPEGEDEDGEENDSGEITTYPPPTNALRDDFPSAPKIAGNLVLQQVNLWVGKSKNGTSSGLVGVSCSCRLAGANLRRSQHHDFHDNVYCLLAGHKRFVLFPPTEAPNLYPHGKIDTVHPNGLISYMHNLVRSDGLGPQEVLSFRIKALEEKIAVMKGKNEKKEAGSII